MINSKGFTLLEIMITMFIVTAVVALTVPVYKSTVEGISAVSASEEAKLDNLLAMEMIRLDLQHVGTGIGLNETTPPIVYNEPALPATPTLDLRSTLINTNESTVGWALINCPGPAVITAAMYDVDQREDQGNNDFVLLDSNENYVANTNLGNNNCPAAGLFTAFPNSGADPATIANACNAGTGFCTNIRYNLSAAQDLETCAIGTRNLLRTVSTGFSFPLVNCVADMRVRFDLDLNNDDRIVPAQGETGLAVLPGTAAGIMNQVRNIDMYLLVQAGNEVRDLRSNPTLTVDGINFSLAGVNNADNYRWKIYKVSGKPEGWF